MTAAPAFYILGISDFMIKTLEWTDEGVVMIDQRLLPTEEVYPVYRTFEEVAWAIKEMVVRGAPAIGVAAAMGVALGARDTQTTDPAKFKSPDIAKCFLFRCIQL